MNRSHFTYYFAVHQHSSLLSGLEVLSAACYKLCPVLYSEAAQYEFHAALEGKEALIAAAHYNAQHLALLGQVGIIVEMYVAHLKEPAAAGFAVAVAGQGVQHACHEGGSHEALIFAEGVQ